ncbi:TonB-dependent receptor plug domain-containing protein [Shewanella carassii]|uniref:TonB-dependent receptor n=1 Tax=Shewanella carassii TaxID=1987584 RepID=A0ABQ1T5W1_9GAMM|nr:TonB-dependent receptor [Shewanella carassii]GGE81281.1 TonB-dependent receptor [Shewanella carassii]
MLKEKLLANAIRFSLFAATGFASLAVASPAMAEEQNEQQIEKIQVTGSRILREGAIAPSPVTVISGESLIKTGAVNIGEALNELPALANTYSLANSGSSIGTAGLNLLDMRGMGASRTLVLVDGKRHVASSPGTSSIDVNTIPTEWVESVEIITGGASAIYGADAVTGVVNFKMKKKIEGLTASAAAGIADDSDYNNQRFSLAYGSNFDNDRGNAAISVEYAQQDRLEMLDRDQTAISWSSLTNPPGSDTYKTLYQNAGYWGISNAGTVGFYGGTPGFYTFKPDGTPVEVGTGEFTNGVLCAGEGCDYINLRQWEELQPEFDRTTINFKTNYDFTDNLNGYFEAKWSRTNATTSGQPAFFFFDPDNTLVTRDNPYISDELGALMDQAGEGYVVVNRFMSDLGPRTEDDERTTQRYVIGLNGVVLEDWEMEAYAIYGQTEQTRTNYNNLIYKNFQQSVDAIRDPVSGEIVCRDADAQAAGCVPVNLFGDGAVTREAADWFSTTTEGTAKIEQYVIGGSMSNSALFELPAGMVGFASGIEYRKEKSKSKEDPFAATGATFFNALQSEGGDFDVKEIYAEISVPLLEDLPGIQNLTVDGAVRYADYSTIGDATSWKLGLDWTIIDSLRLRSTLSTALRAPNIGEYYGAQGQNFFSVDDSCKASELSGLSPDQQAIRAANCAALGIPADFDSNYDSATLEGVSGGNDQLEPEESDSYTVGLVYQPSFVEGLVMTVDYWNIEITDAIANISAQNIIDRCVDSPTGINNQYCDLITRDATSHEITNITQIVQNVAKQEASGVDFEVGYDFPLFGGDLRTNLLGTYLIERNEYPFQDDATNYEEYAGTLGEAQWQGQLVLNYSYDAWNLNWKTRYLDSVDLYTPQFRANYDVPYSNVMSYGSYSVTDLYATYTMDNGLEFGLGIDNAFDRDLPGSTTGTGAGSASYDNIGRFYYLTVKYEM